MLRHMPTIDAHVPWEDALPIINECIVAMLTVPSTNRAPRMANTIKTTFRVVIADAM